MKRLMGIPLGLAACGLALFMAANASAQTPVPLPANCVAWWRGESNMLDTAGVNHGASFNGATYAPGKVGQAFRFGGTNAVIVPDAAALRFGTGGLTVEAWIKTTAAGGMFFTKESQIQYPYQGIDLYEEAGRVRFLATDCNTSSCGAGSPGNMPVWSPGRLDDGQWHHVAGVRSATKLDFFVDGQLVATVTQAPLNPDTTALLFLGAGNTNESGQLQYPWTGLVDELAIYNRALTTNEIAAIYAAGSTGKIAPQPVAVPLPTNCVSWWRAETNANDSVGANNGTLMNGATFAVGEVGQGFSLDGMNDYIEVPTAPNLNLTSGQGWTMEGWIKADALTGTQVIAHKGRDWSGGNPFWAIYLSPDVLRFEMVPASWGDYSTVISSQALLAGQWQHFAVVADAIGGSVAGYHLYINGSDAGISYSHQGIAGGVSTTEPLRIGAMNNNGSLAGFFKGQMDEFAIYNRALSAAEIAAIYTAGSAGKTVSSATAPSITSQPQSRTNMFATTATFSVTATGTAPLSYQWRKGGTPLTNTGNIFGATSNVLTLANLVFTNAGNYDVVITNLSGSVTSAPLATLTVTQVVAGVSLGSLARTYNGSAQVVTATTTPSGLAYTVTYDGSTTPPVNAGSYAVVATVTDPGYSGSAGGTLVIDKATLVIAFGALPGKVIGDTPFTLNATLGGSSSPAIVYSSGNTNVARISGNTVTLVGVGSTWITASYPGDANHYAASDVSQLLTVSGVGASITQPPIGQVVSVGGQATFNVTATGTGPLHYQWYFNDTLLGGESGPSLTITNAAPGTAGVYKVTVWNMAATNTSAAASLWLNALKMYAGVNVYGPVGSSCVVQYATNLIAPVTWTQLQSVTIVTNPTVIIDYGSPDQPHRFYQTLPQ